MLRAVSATPWVAKTAGIGCERLTCPPSDLDSPFSVSRHSCSLPLFSPPPDTHHTDTPQQSLNPLAQSRSPLEDSVLACTALWHRPPKPVLLTERIRRRWLKTPPQRQRRASTATAHRKLDFCRPSTPRRHPAPGGACVHGLLLAAGNRVDRSSCKHLAAGPRYHRDWPFRRCSRR